MVARVCPAGRHSAAHAGIPPPPTYDRWFATGDLVAARAYPPDRTIPRPPREVHMLPSARPAARPRIEGLEARSLLSAAPAAVGDGTDLVGPHLANIRLVGPNQAVTAVVLTFDEALNPTTAQDLGAYVVLKKVRTS